MRHESARWQSISCADRVPHRRSLDDSRRPSQLTSSSIGPGPVSERISCDSPSVKREGSGRSREGKNKEGERRSRRETTGLGEKNEPVKPRGPDHPTAIPVAAPVRGIPTPNG